MKQKFDYLLKILILLLLAGGTLISCGESEAEAPLEEVIETEDDEEEEEEEEEDEEEEEEEEEEGDGLYLSKIDADNIPEEDTWVINNTTAETTDFAGLSAAIEALYETGRTISLEFPNLESIPDFAIYGVRMIEDRDYLFYPLISLSAPQATSVGMAAFFSCYSLATIDLPQVTYVGVEAFWDCYELSSLSLPLATTIDSGAFSGCKTLTTINLPIATTIEDWVFSSCYALQTIELPAATSLGTFCLCYNTALTTVKLPATTSIGYWAFKYCNALTSIELATDDGVQISDIGTNGSYTAFDDITTEEITLTVGSANSEYVDGTTLTVGVASKVFKEIIVL